MKLQDAVINMTKHAKENKMPFTQEKKTNVVKCHGCDKYCELGVKCVNDVFFPCVDGKKIESYTDKNGNTHSITKTMQEMETMGCKDFADVRRVMVGVAHEVAKLCNHYKTR